jgi:hypothetical protein
MRSTPMSLVTLEGVRYVVSGEGLAWVKNARVAGWGELLRARRRERVSLTELPPDERGPILRAFWHQVPAGRSFIARLFGLAPGASADDFEAAAPVAPCSGSVRPVLRAPVRSASWPGRRGTPRPRGGSARDIPCIAGSHPMVREGRSQRGEPRTGPRRGRAETRWTVGGPSGRQALRRPPPS